jgi:hypothetical protein
MVVAWENSPEMTPIKVQRKYRVQQPPHRIFTHLFDFEVDQIHPLDGITQTEDMHYLSQWFGPPVQELQESATIEEAIECCQAHYDSLLRGMTLAAILGAGVCRFHARHPRRQVQNGW